MSFDPMSFALSVIRLVFRLKGRAARLPFLGFLIVNYGAFVWLVTVWNRQPAGAMKATLNLLILLILVTKFMAIGKRLHDVSLSALFGLPYLFPPAAGFYANFIAEYVPAHGQTYYFVPYPIFGQIMTYQQLAGVATLILIAIADIVFLFVPGTKGPNRFGPQPGKPVAPPQDVF